MKKVSFLIYILFLTISFSFSQTKNLNFEHYTIDDGLSNNEIKCIVQDNNGFIWFGTKDGLNKYDGYQFKTYNAKRTDSTTIRGKVIFSLLVNKKGQLLVGTDEGLDYYDPDLDIFFPYPLILSEQSIKSNVILSLFEDKNSNLWIGTRSGVLCHKVQENVTKSFKDSHGEEGAVGSAFIHCIFQDSRSDIWIATDKGLGKYDKEKDVFNNFSTSWDDNATDNRNEFITWIIEDTIGNLWLGTQTGGLIQMDVQTNRITRYINKPLEPSSLSNNYVSNLIFNSNNELLLGTYRGGLNIYNSTTNDFQYVVHNPIDSKSLISNNIFTLFEDVQKNLWIGTGNGLSCYKPQLKPFVHYKHIPLNKNSISSNTVKSIHEDTSGNLWIGTKEGGVNQYNRKKNKFIRHLPKPGNPEAIVSKDIFAILEDSDNNLWFGGSNGLSLYNSKKNSFTNYESIERQANGLSSPWVLSLAEADKDHLWVGTAKGLNYFDKTTGFSKEYSHDPNNPNSIADNWIVTLYKDKLGYLWIGTALGLSVFDEGNQRFINYLPSGEEYSISNKLVLVIYEDIRGRFWIGTEDGLNLFDKKLERFIHYTDKDGLADNVINGICEDDNSNLWISTNKGISVFNPDSITFLNFDKYEGLQSNQFLNGSYFKSNSGELFFGGVNGFNSFRPEKISYNKYVPNVVITDLLIMNQRVIAGMLNSPVQNNINEVSELTLDYSQRFFGFEFVAINYLNPQKNQYRFILDGFDKEWRGGINNRTVNYTNVPPGKYVFKLLASNNDGVWNRNVREIKIRIKPPWWLTWWAFLFYVGVFVVLLIIFRKYSLIGANLKHQLMMEHFEREKTEELNQLKIKFFTNISHELRTPLTLIISPLERLLSKYSFAKENYTTLKLMHRSAGRMLHLINQLMEFRKSETGNSRLRTSESELNSFVSDVVHSFRDLAYQRNIDLVVSSKEEKIMLWLDKDKCEKVIVNLLSNAFKFTNEKGKIFIKTFIVSAEEAGKTLKNPKRRSDYAVIAVTDSGAGIPVEHIRKIFDRFYQIETEGKTGNYGSGIGLALSKNLVELHHGELHVQSEPGVETSFKIYLPLGKSHLQKKEVNYKDKTTDKGFLELSAISIIEDNRIEQNEINDSETIRQKSHLKKAKLLIVEDDVDVRQYLTSQLSVNYDVLSASNGLEGIDLAKTESPDLIVSDIMMPQMDGIEMCEQLKSELLTSHIPIILLTAKVSDEYQKQGLETGADDYVIKPFSPEILELKINNLIESRKNLQKKFSGKPNLPTKEITTTSADRKFLDKVEKAIKANMENTDFGVESLGDKMAMSRSNLYRKINALTGQTSIEFIRTVRLKEAAALLMENSLEIYDIMDAVGFQNIKYFRKCFLTQYGCKPEDYFDYMSELESEKDDETGSVQA